jgi:hypothetical protein
MYKKRLLIVSVLLIFSILIHIYSANSLRVENGYSVLIYPKIAVCLRFLTGWLPFSIGDILYGTATVWLIWKLFRGIYLLFKKRVNAASVMNGLLKIIIIALSVYIIFNILWGINYNREGIAYQLKLNGKQFTAVELKSLDSILLQKVNESKLALIHSNDTLRNTKEIFAESNDAYKIVSAKFPFLNYKVNSVKSSMWGWVGNYFGFTGYYDPFTGEAQVNTTVPYFLQPYTTCHEMAHQLGYAKEDEANFVGYLAASASTDTLFHYSVYLDIFLATNRNLFNVDSVAARAFGKQLLPQVKADLKAWRVFIMKHQNPAEPIVQWLYGKYLERNNQPSGILTYDEVTALLIEYYKHYGKI